MSPSRREFLTRYARWGGLAALGAVTARLIWTNRNTCARPSPCGACPLLTGCTLPRAQAAHQPDPAKPKR